MFVQQVAQALADSPTVNLVPAQFTLSTFMVWIIDLLKRSDKFPWLSKETQRLNQFAGIFAAALTAAGIHFVMETEVVAAGSYVIHISGLTTEGVVHFVKGFAIAIASQQTILKLYQITGALQLMSKPTAAPIVEQPKV